MRMHEGTELDNAKKCWRKLNSRSGSVIFGVGRANCHDIEGFSLIFLFFYPGVQPFKEKSTYCWILW